MRLQHPTSRNNESPDTFAQYRMGVMQTLLLFGGAALLLYLATHGLIPVLSGSMNIEPILLWFIVSGLLVFTPLLIMALLLLRREGAPFAPHLWRDRLRFRSMERSDWLWSLGALVAIGALSAGSLLVLNTLTGGAEIQPSFTHMEPLTPGRYWILAIWLPFWILNIMGEEIFWRGVVLPRQEIALGRWSWLANGGGWLVFHLSFGGAIVVSVLPILFILPYVAQRRQNSWTGVIIHAGLNGPGFLAVAFGLV